MENDSLGMSRARPRIGILSNAVLGGAQRAAVQAARALAPLGDVEFAPLGEIDRTALSRGHGGPLPFRTVRLPLTPHPGDPDGWREPLPWVRTIEEWTGTLDLFLNFEKSPGIRPRARRSVYYCYFPYFAPPRLLAIDSYDRVVAGSGYARTWIRKRWGIHSPPVLYPGVRSHPGAPASRTSRDRTVLSLGTFGIERSSGLHRKRQDLLIHAWHDLCARRSGMTRGWRLVLAGAWSPMTPGLDELRRLAASGPGTVRIVVNPPRPIVDRLLSRAALLWHACGIGSADPANHEHFGIAVAEGMATGAVPVAAGIGGIPEIVEDGESGFLVRDAAGFAERTERLLEDRRLLTRMTHAARRRAERFSEARFTNGIQSLSRRLLTLPRAGRNGGSSPSPLEVANTLARIPSWRGAWRDERLRGGHVQRLTDGPVRFAAATAPREPARIVVRVGAVPGRARLCCIASGRPLGARSWGPRPSVLSWPIPPGAGAVRGEIVPDRDAPHVWITAPDALPAVRYDAVRPRVTGPSWTGLAGLGPGWRRAGRALLAPPDARALLFCGAPGRFEIQGLIRVTQRCAPLEILVDGRLRRRFRGSRPRPIHMRIPVRCADPRGVVHLRIRSRAREGGRGPVVESVRIARPARTREILAFAAGAGWDVYEAARR